MGEPFQRLTQIILLDSELVFVGEVLKGAAAAEAEVRAGGFYPERRWLFDGYYFPVSEPFAFSYDFYPYHVFRYCARDKEDISINFSDTVVVGEGNVGYFYYWGLRCPLQWQSHRSLPFCLAARDAGYA